MEKLYEGVVWGKISPISKPELHCHKASTELLNFREVRLISAPVQLMSSRFLLHRTLQFLWHTRKVLRGSSNRGKVRPWLRFWRSYSRQWQTRCSGWFWFLWAVKTRILLLCTFQTIIILVRNNQLDFSYLMYLFLLKYLCMLRISSSIHYQNTYPIKEYNK